MRDIEIQEKIDLLLDQMKQNANDFKYDKISYEELHAYQYELTKKIEDYQAQLKGVKTCLIEINPNESYIIYDALTDMVFKASENKDKYANGYSMIDIQELADRFSKIQIQNQW